MVPGIGFVPVMLSRSCSHASRSIPGPVAIGGIGVLETCGSRTMSVIVSFAKSASVWVMRKPRDRIVEKGREIGSVA